MITKKQFQSVSKPQTVSLDIMKAKGTLFYKTLRYTFTPPPSAWMRWFSGLSLNFLP